MVKIKPFVVLVTGFGAFPGAPHNPTEDLIENLGAQEKLSAGLGIKLERRILPVVFDEIAPKLENLIAETAPDAILHFGLAARRRLISIETRALNRLGTTSPDAAGKYAEHPDIVKRGTAVARARIPVRAFAAALGQAGFLCRTSSDAGDYVCNQTFYLSLAMAQGTARQVGFIHVPHMPAVELERAAIALITALRPEPRK